ncbi:MAG: hypothetical protein NPMRTH1_760003 [Nitrosopumilales archaeon]|nr:MAG: hypothetical protein NPMRTH1_760003 [Nitrosopumilales archaeon]
MDVYDGIIKSIIEGYHHFEKILTGARKSSKTSRVTFNKHLKQLVKDGYVLRNDQGKQLIEYQINPDAFDVAQGFLDDHGEKEFQDGLKKILDSDIDYSKSPKDIRDKLIREYDEKLHIYLTKQNLATLVIHSLHDGDITARNKAIKSREEYDHTIELIFAMIKRIDPELYKIYPGFTFYDLQKDPVSILNSELIKYMEAGGMVSTMLKKSEKKKKVKKKLIKLKTN